MTLLTPVFSADHQIQGYLAHDEADQKHPWFYRRVISQLGVGAHPIELDPGLVSSESYTVRFQWAVIGASRGLDDTYHCNVLIVDRPDLLSRIEDFGFFAEVHGEKVKQPNYARTRQ
jgi:hypothetical protein